VEQVLSGFVQDVQHLYGDDLVAVFLYGSATTGEYVPGRSDLNVGVVLSRLTPALLRKASGHVRAWARQGFATPMFFDPEFLRGGADVFPIEFLDMQTHHRCLWGPDILADLRIGAALLRRQCEHELRRTLVRLRQAFVESARSPKDLEALTIQEIIEKSKVFLQSYPEALEHPLATAEETNGPMKTCAKNVAAPTVQG